VGVGIEKHMDVFFVKTKEIGLDQFGLSIMYKKIDMLL
jgi:hypothetical protein